MEKMTVKFDRCKGCGLCITACPKKIVALQKEHRNEKGYFTAVCTDQDACISCASMTGGATFKRTFQIGCVPKNSASDRLMT